MNRVKPGFTLTSCTACLLVVMFAGVQQPVSGAEMKGEDLVVKNRCYPCHSKTDMLLGPSYEAIAARHAANREAMVEVLAEKIIVGGGGNWGVVPMVPNEHVSREDARRIARWILKLDK